MSEQQVLPIHFLDHWSINWNNLHLTIVLFGGLLHQLWILKVNISMSVFRQLKALDCEVS